MSFECTKQAATNFAELLRCSNIVCRQPSDQLQNLGSACKHAFCWDCINEFTEMNTMVLCPVCSMPLELQRPRAAQMFNNLSRHINKLHHLLNEYDRAVQTDGAAARVEAIEQAQKLLEAQDGLDVERNDEAARKAAIEEFISSQPLSIDDEGSDNDDEENSSECYSEELYDAPKSTWQVMVPEHTAERHRSEGLENCDGDIPNEKENEVIAPATANDRITSSVAQLREPLMTSTQQPSLFLTQAEHECNDLFKRMEEAESQEVRSSEKLYTTKPKRIYRARKHKISEAPRLDLAVKGTTPAEEESAGSKCDNDILKTELLRRSKTPKRGPKVKSRHRSGDRKSSFSTPKSDKRQNDPVIAAVLSGNFDDVQAAVEAGYDVNQRDDQKRTPLFIAVEMERLDICQCLVERGGAVINANCGYDCNTALHVAVSRGNEGIVKYLLSKGASKTVFNLRRETPSQLAQPHSSLQNLVEKYRTHPKQPLMVARLPDTYVVCIAQVVRRACTYQDFSIMNKLITMVEFCDEATTHYVASVDENDVGNCDADFLRAMMQSTRIMSPTWLKESIRLKRVLPHTNFEISKLRYGGDRVICDSLSRCRKSKERMEPGLFHGCTFYFLTKKLTGFDNRHLLRDLIRLGGGELSLEEPEFLQNAPPPYYAPHLSSPLFIVYDVTATKSIPTVFHEHPMRYNLVTPQWIIESVVEFTIKPVS
ncbi:Ankyrin repeat [Parelaphostrongylus tenuis]|uniref:Ankyrin repeat n=1 Tax=Parelaphostrongylus tenuis TaxID=148309 RepID=A0AAD5MFS6_PARTN|nr:Ankyrin repeat [Parelaphostrongylus tenuis]